MNSTFLALPNELIECVLDFLPPPSLLRCKQVSRLFFSLITGSIPLVYGIELYSAHLLDNSASSLSVAARLRLLGVHQNAWENLSWSNEFKLPFTGLEPAFIAWELTNSTFGFAGSHSLRFFQLPSRLRGITQREWSLEGFDFRIRDFATDKSQDLLVLIERETPAFLDSIRVHLYSLSTGKPHPLALLTSLIHCIHIRDADPDWYAVHIFGDYVAVMLEAYAPLDNELVLWNWKFGQVKTVFTGPISGFSFLSEQFMLIAMLRLSADQESMSISLDVADLGNLPSFLNLAPSLATIFAEYPHLNWWSFALPTIAEQVMNSGVRPSLHIRTDYSPLDFAPHREIPFTTSAADRLYVVTISEIFPYDSLSLFFRLSSLLSMVNTVASHQTFPWRDWGPDHTRLVQRRMSPSWFCYVHGFRAVVTSSDHKIEVWDFNQFALRRNISQSPINRPEYVLESTAITPRSEKRRFFEEDIVTSLPYSVRTRVTPNTNDVRQVFMLSEDCIALVEVGLVFVLPSPVEQCVRKKS